MAGGPEFVIVAGLSGAGRSTAANALEDVGWFVIDNLPPNLIPDVAELVARPGARLRRVALVAGTREYREDLVAAIARLRESNASVRVMFLDAPTDVLVRRYDDTRRRHPLHTGDAELPGKGGIERATGAEPVAESVIDAIELERRLLSDVRETADVVIDTADLNVHDLSDRVREEFRTSADEPQMRTAVMSFGYKHGVPRDADLVFDCRFLPNPHWVSDLRPFTGLDHPVREWVLGQPASSTFLDRLMPLLESLLPAYRAEGKSYLTIAMGCTGGRHRSVVVAEEVSRLLAERGHDLQCRHRDIDR